MVGQNVGKYRVLDRVGRGGMGTVYRAIDETLHREVAIKVLNAELNDPEVARRFRAEAITVARLSHPGIATIYELFQHDGQWLMVMEFVRGETLERLVERTGPQVPNRAAELCIQSLSALAHAHAMGVVHRDLKPANIMLTETGSIKIMDFGIARVTGSEHLTNAGFMMGTPAYMAPEQVLGHDIDARADLYAMGVVFFRLLTSQLPFKGDTPFAMAQAQVNNPPTPVRTFRQDLPAWVEDVLAKSLAKKPDDRFQSAVEFQDGLARLIAGQSASGGYRSPASDPGTPSSTGVDMTVLVTTPRSGTMPTLQRTALDADASGTAPTIATATPAATARSGAIVSPPGEATAAESVRLSGAFQGAVDPPSTTKRPLLIAAAAGLIAVLGGAAFFMTRSTAPAAPAPGETAVDSSVPAPAAPVVIEPTAPAPAPQTAAPVAATPPATPAGAAPAAASTGARGADAGRGTPPVAAPTPAAGRAAAPPADDPLLAITNVRYLVVDGRRTRDEEILLNFVGGHITLVDRRAGTAVASVPYADIAGMTYVRARDPRWNSALAAPANGLDVGGILRTPKHWLTLQTVASFLILRLEDVNVIRVLQAVEARTGRKVDRPVSTDRE